MKLPNLNYFGLKDAFIAGGAVLSTVTKTEINDIDVYPKSKQGRIAAIEALMDNDCFVIKLTEKAITFKSNKETNDKGERLLIQVMTLGESPTADSIFELFDFSVCMGAFDCDTGEYIFHPDFLLDIAAHNLTFNPKTLYPLNSLIRLNKYRAKGFYISKPQVVKMAIAAAAKGLPESWEQLESQIGGSYGRILKLARQGLELTAENIFTVMDSISGEDFDCYEQDVSEEFTKFTVDQICALYEDSPKLYFTFNQGTNNVCHQGQWESNSALYFLDDSEIKGGFTANQMAIVSNFGIPANWFAVNDNASAIGYKVVEIDPKKPGVLLPGVYPGKNNVTYGFDQETVYETAPYLYVFPSLEDAKKRLNGIGKPVGRQLVIHQVTFKLADIKSISFTEKKSFSFSEIQVTKMKLGNRIAL